MKRQCAALLRRYLTYFPVVAIIGPLSLVIHAGERSERVTDRITALPFTYL